MSRKSRKPRSKKSKKSRKSRKPRSKKSRKSRKPRSKKSRKSRKPRSKKSRKSKQSNQSKKSRKSRKPLSKIKNDAFNIFKPSTWSSPKKENIIEPDHDISEIDDKLYDEISKIDILTTKQFIYYDRLLRKIKPQIDKRELVDDPLKTKFYEMYSKIKQYYHYPKNLIKPG
jgi:hypothetical protein